MYSEQKKLCSKKYLEEALNFLIDMFVENGLLSLLNSIVEENKHQAPKTENTNNNIVKEKKRTSKDRM